MLCKIIFGIKLINFQFNLLYFSFLLLNAQPGQRFVVHFKTGRPFLYYRRMTSRPFFSYIYRLL